MLANFVRPHFQSEGQPPAIILNSAVGVELESSKILIVGRYQRLMTSKIAHPFGEGKWLNN